MSYIYILTNESMEGLVKIGMTERKPSERARELSTTGVPTPFNVEAFWKVPEGLSLKQMERKCHNELSEYRLHNNREFFRIPKKDAIAKLSVLIPTQEELDRKRKEQAAANELAFAQMQQRKKHDLQKQLKQLEEDMLHIDGRIETNNAQIRQTEKQLEKPESFAHKAADGASTAVLTPVFLFFRFFWVAIPILVLTLNSSPFPDRIFLAVAGTIGFVFFGFMLVPLLLPILKIAELPKKALGPSHEDLKGFISDKQQDIELLFSKKSEYQESFKRITLQLEQMRG